MTIIAFPDKDKLLKIYLDEGGLYVLEFRGKLAPAGVLSDDEVFRLTNIIEQAWDKLHVWERSKYPEYVKTLKYVMTMRVK